MTTTAETRVPFAPKARPYTLEEQRRAAEKLDRMIAEDGWTLDYNPSSERAGSMAAIDAEIAQLCEDTFLLTGIRPPVLPL